MPGEYRDHWEFLTDRANEDVQDALQRATAAPGAAVNYARRWEDIEGPFRQQFPSVDAEQARLIYLNTRQQSYDARRIQQAAESEAGRVASGMRSAIGHIPFGGHVFAAGDERRAAESAERLRAGRATAQDYQLLGERERHAGSEHPFAPGVRALFGETAAEATPIVANIPTFVSEFGAGAGVGRAAGGGVSGLIRPLVERGVGRAIGRGTAAATIGAAAGGLPGGLAGAGAMTATTGLPHVAEEVARRMTPRVTVGFDRGQPVEVDIGEPRSFLSALPAGAFDAYTEILSERVGGTLMRGAGVIGRATGIPWLARRLGGQRLGNYAGYLAQGILGRMPQGMRNTALRMASAAARGADEAGNVPFHGLIGEYLEERFGDVLRGSVLPRLGDQDATYGTTGRFAAALDPIATPEERRQALRDFLHASMVEGIAFSVWGTANVGAQTLGTPRRGTREWQDQRQGLATQLWMARRAGPEEYQAQLLANRPHMRYFRVTEQNLNQLTPEVTRQDPPQYPEHWTFDEMMRSGGMDVSPPGVQAQVTTDTQSPDQAVIDQYAAEAPPPTEQVSGPGIIARAESGGSNRISGGLTGQQTPPGTPPAAPGAAPTVQGEPKPTSVPPASPTAPGASQATGYENIPLERVQRDARHGVEGAKRELERRQAPAPAAPAAPAVETPRQVADRLQAEMVEIGRKVGMSSGKVGELDRQVRHAEEAVDNARRRVGAARRGRDRKEISDANRALANALYDLKTLKHQRAQARKRRDQLIPELRRAQDAAIVAEAKEAEKKRGAPPPPFVPGRMPRGPQPAPPGPPRRPIRRDKPVVQRLRASAFRDPGTGKVYETGVFHDLGRLPKEVRQKENVLEDGFVTERGEFLTREQAEDKFADGTLKPLKVSADDIRGMEDADIEPALVDRRGPSRPRQGTFDLLRAEHPDWSMEQIARRAGEIADQARTDALTGLLSAKTYFEDVESGQYGKFVSLYDIPGLGAVNTYGDQAGDAFLKAYAEALRQAGVENGYRKGGDELAAIYQTAEEQKAAGDKLEKILSGMKVHWIDKKGKATMEGVFGVARSDGASAFDAQSKLNDAKEVAVERGFRAREKGKLPPKLRIVYEESVPGSEPRRRPGARRGTGVRGGGEGISVEGDLALDEAGRIIDAPAKLAELFEQRGLTKREGYVLRRRLEGMTQEAIGKKMGVTRARIQQIEKEALGKLGANESEAVRQRIAREEKRREFKGKGKQAEGLESEGAGGKTVQDDTGVRAKIHAFLDLPADEQAAVPQAWFDEMVAGLDNLSKAELLELGQSIGAPYKGSAKNIRQRLGQWLRNIKTSADQTSFKVSEGEPKVGRKGARKKFRKSRPLHEAPLPKNVSQVARDIREVSRRGISIASLKMTWDQAREEFGNEAVLYGLISAQGMAVDQVADAMAKRHMLPGIDPGVQISKQEWIGQESGKAHAADVLLERMRDANRRKWRDESEEELLELQRQAAEAHAIASEGEIGVEPDEVPVEIMGEQMMLADSQEIDGIVFDLFESPTGGAVRVTDKDSGNIISLKKYPSREALNAAYDELVSKARKQGRPSEEKQFFAPRAQQANLFIDPKVGAMPQPPGDMHRMQAEEDARRRREAERQWREPSQEEQEALPDFFNDDFFTNEAGMLWVPDRQTFIDWARSAWNFAKKTIQPRKRTATPALRVAQTVLPRFQPYHEEKIIFTDPLMLARLPGIGGFLDPRAFADNGTDQAYITWAASDARGKSWATAEALRIKGQYGEDLFQADKDGTVALTDGTRGYMSDVIRDELTERGSQPITDQQRDFIWNEWLPLVRDFRRMLNDAGVTQFADDTGDLVKTSELDRYFPRPAIGKRKVEGTFMGGFGSQARPGGKKFFMKKRLYGTEQAGVEAEDSIIYEPNYAARIAKMLAAGYRSIADKRLAADESLGGMTPRQRYELLKIKHRGTLRKFKKGSRNRAEFLQQLKEEALLRGKARHAVGLREAYVTVAPAFAGKIYPIEVANKLRKMFGESSHEWVRKWETVNSASKALTAAFDFSVLWIQGLPLAMTRSAVWARSVANMARAMLDPKVQQKHAQVNAKSIREFVQAGGTYGRPQDALAGAIEGELATKRSGGAALGAVAGALTGAAVGGPAGAVVGGAIGGLAGAGFSRVVGAFGRGTATFFDTAKIALWNAHKDSVPKERWHELAEDIENMLGLSHMEQIGLHPGRALGERLLVFAPMYLRSGVANIAAMTHRGVSGRMALRHIGGMVGSLILLHIGAMLLMGYDWDEILDRLNPTKGNFLKLPIKIGDTVQEVGFGHIVVQLFRLGGQVADYFRDGDRINTPSSIENPVVRFLRYKLAASLSLAFDIGTERDVMGRPITPTEAVAQRFIPFSVQEMLHGDEQVGEGVAQLGRGEADWRERGGQALFSFFGLQSYTRGARGRYFDRFGEVARERFGRDYNALTLGEARQVAVDVRRRFGEPPAADDRGMEMGRAASETRRSRLTRGVSDQARQRLGAFNHSLPSYRRSLTMNRVTVPLTDRWSDRYEELLIQEYDRTIASWPMERLRRMDAGPRELLIERTLWLAKERAQARLRGEMNRRS